MALVEMQTMLTDTRRNNKTRRRRSNILKNWQDTRLTKLTVLNREEGKMRLQTTPTTRFILTQIPLECTEVNNNQVLTSIFQMPEFNF